MKQLFQPLDSGTTALFDVPAPSVLSSSVRIVTAASVVSVGTERMLVEFGQSAYFHKARQQPERVRQVVDRARTDGVGATVAAVRGRLAQPLPLGYCNAGVVESVGEGVESVHVGERVVSNGPHAEIVAVGVNVVARIPEGVSFEAAAFAPLGGIGLHGVRLATPTLGERFAVIGLGLVGLLTVQILRAHGCEVLGIDLDTARVDRARGFGAQAVNISAGEDPVEAAMAFTEGVGVDGVLVTAATKSGEPIHQAAAMSREKGRIVLIGTAGLNLSRDVFYQKELSFQVSRSYGPGRYDPDYEERGLDYPLPYVRWTEGRNLAAVLRLMARGAVDAESLITHRIPFDESPKAYDLLAEGSQALGIVLLYPERAEGDHDPPTRIVIQDDSAAPADAQQTGVGVVGAGTYAVQTLLPLLVELDVDRAMIASSRGGSAGVAARRFGFRVAASDAGVVLDDSTVGAVFILTRHDSHAQLAADALRAGKAVFVEKPLAISNEALEQVREAWNDAAAGGSPCLTVGFNRRFSPHVERAGQLLGSVSGPKFMVMTVNAGPLPKGHWLAEPLVGGGRLLGEACHFIDLLRHLAGSPIDDIGAMALEERRDRTPQTFTVTLRFADGSLGTVHYFANGHRRFPKERLEVFAAGRTLVLDNFRRLRGFGWPGFRGARTRRQDKGHRGLVEAFLAAAEGRGPQPIPIAEIFEVSEAVLRANQMLASRHG